jgi:hypothetical protein
LNNTKGIGSISIDKNANNEVAHGMVMVLYTANIFSKKSIQTRSWRNNLLCTVKSGKTADMPYRRRPLAANALAPLSGPYTSTRYNAAEIC